jgi:hypothetical protein
LIYAGIGVAAGLGLAIAAAKPTLPIDAAADPLYNRSKLGLVVDLVRVRIKRGESKPSTSLFGA